MSQLSRIEFLWPALGWLQRSYKEVVGLGCILEVSFQLVDDLKVGRLVEGRSCGRQNNGPPKMPTSLSPEPVNIITSHGQRWL